MKLFLLILLIGCLTSVLLSGHSNSSSIIPAKYTDEYMVGYYGYYNKKTKVFTTCDKKKINNIDEKSISPYYDPCSAIQHPPTIDSVAIRE